VQRANFSGQLQQPGVMAVWKYELAAVEGKGSLIGGSRVWWFLNDETESFFLGDLLYFSDDVEEYCVRITARDLRLDDVQTELVCSGGIMSGGSASGGSAGEPITNPPPVAGSGTTPPEDGDVDEENTDGGSRTTITEGGCGCRIVPSGAHGEGWLSLAALGAFGFAWGRRRRALGQKAR
jgi:hypothetical protein